MRPIRFALIACAATLAFTAVAAADPAPRLLTVSATGAVQGIPDRAELTAGVVTQAATAASALAQNSAKMQSVFAALERLGVPKTAIRTSNFSVSPDYSNGNGSARQILTYSVSNTVTVTLALAAQTGAMLDALTAAGANQIYGVRFGIADPGPLLTKAREEAVREASEEARTYAAAAGVTLGPIQSISAAGGMAPQPVMMARAMAAPAPIAPGTENVSASVTIVWEIR